MIHVAWGIFGNWTFWKECFALQFIVVNVIYNEIWSFASAKAAFLPRLPQSAKQCSWCYASPERVLGSVLPKNWVRSQAVVGELLLCACWACGKTQHLRTITLEKICRMWKWTCWKWYGTNVACLACPFSLFPSPYALWGFPAIEVLELLSSYTRTHRSSISPHAFPVLLQEASKLLVSSGKALWRESFGTAL